MTLKRIGKIRFNVDKLLILWLIFIAFLYFSNMSYGALGDDSPGYIFMASKIVETGSSTYQDEIVHLFLENGLNARLALPHSGYNILNDDGLVGSVSAEGYPRIMAFFYIIFGPIGFYIVNPLLSVLFLMSFYCLLKELFPFRESRTIFAFVCTFILSINGFFWTLSTYQPMTDTTPLLFICLSMLLFIKSFRIEKSGMLLIGLSGLLFGWGLCIRYANVVLLLPFFAFFIYSERRKLMSLSNIRLITIFTICILFASSVAIMNIHENKTLQYHSQWSDDSTIKPSGLSLENIYNNQGKFKPGVGSFFIYKDVIMNKIFAPNILFFLIIGCLFLLVHSKISFIFITLWMFAIVSLYLMWVNPYWRYIAPAIPAFIVLYVSALFAIPKLMVNKRIRILSITILVILVVIGNMGSIARTDKIIFGNPSLPSDKSVSYGDFQNVMSIDNNFDAFVTMGKSNTMIGFLRTYLGTPFIIVSKGDTHINEIDILLKNGYKVGLWYDGSDSKTFGIIKSNYNLTEYSINVYDTMGTIKIYSIDY
jgi:Dolichyl-phosphate-mannose-protein mannosyltransferase